ncbi:MAG: 30S ribosomal protein S21 [Elusimicrobiota bacterium]
MGPKVEKKDNESVNSLLRRFRRKCSKSGIKKELKRRRFYLSASEVRKINKSMRERDLMKDQANRKRRQKLIKTRKRRG